MSKLKWDQIGERLYETGVNKGVLYPFAKATNNYPTGVAWNGLTAVNESPSGAEATEAYMYPDEFAVCNGEAELAAGVTVGQQARITFGLSYQTKIGSDQDSEKGYKIHLIYGALASPSEKSYATVNDSPEAITFSWELKTTPVEVEGFKPTATLVIDSTKVDPDKLAALEAILYVLQHLLK